MKKVVILLIFLLFLSNLTILHFPELYALPDTDYYASTYTLLGQTQYVSGALSDLQSNNGVYMTFRSYITSTDTTSKTDASIVYRSNTGVNTLNSPKHRNWDGDTVAWSNEEELSTAGSEVRWVRNAYSPLQTQARDRIAVTLGADGNLDAYIYGSRQFWVDGFVNEINQWFWYGFPANPLIAEGDGAYCTSVYPPTSTDRYYTFADLPSGVTSIDKVEFYIKVMSTGATATAKVLIWDGSSYRYAGKVSTSSSSSWYWKKLDVSNILDTTTKVDDARLQLTVDAEIWSGDNIRADAAFLKVRYTDAWTVINNIGSTAATTSIRPYDISFETSTGRALLVYDISVADATKDLAYRLWADPVDTTWFGSGFSPEYYIDFTGVASTNPTVSFVRLASNPNTTSNQLAMAFQDDTNADTFAAIWSGSAWGYMTTISTAYTIVGRETIAIEYSTYFNKILVLSGNGANSMAWKWYVQGAGDWTAGTAFDPDPDAGNDVCFSMLKSDPAASSTDDYIMYAGVNDLSDLNAWIWDMADVTPGRYYIVNEVDEGLDSATTRCIDFAWEVTDNKGLIVWGTTSGAIHYNTFSAAVGWGASWSTSIPAAGTHPWVQLRTNTRNIAGDTKILGAMLNSAFDLGALKWDGATLTNIGDATFTADTTATAYECFELEFQKVANPTEFTSDIEFSGSSNLGSWTQLTWTVDSAFTTSSVSLTLQLYDYNAGQYPTSGDGYIGDIIGTVDITKSQTITLNPTHFRDGSGNWQLKVKGVKATTTQFEWKGDLLVYTPEMVLQRIVTQPVQTSTTSSRQVVQQRTTVNILQIFSTILRIFFGQRHQQQSLTLTVDRLRILTSLRNPTESTQITTTTERLQSINRLPTLSLSALSFPIRAIQHFRLPTLTLPLPHQIVSFVTIPLKIRTVIQSLSFTSETLRLLTQHRTTITPLHLFPSSLRFSSVQRTFSQPITLEALSLRSLLMQRTFGSPLQIITTAIRFQIFQRTTIQPIKLYTLITKQFTTIRIITQPLQTLTKTFRTAQYARIAIQPTPFIHKITSIKILYEIAPPPPPPPLLIPTRYRFDIAIITMPSTVTYVAFFKPSFQVEINVINKGLETDAIVMWELFDVKGQKIAHSSFTTHFKSKEAKSFTLTIPTPTSPSSYSLRVRVTEPAKAIADQTFNVTVIPSYTIILAILIALFTLIILIKRRRR